MKKVWSRNVSFVLAIALLLSVIPAFSVGADAVTAPFATATYAIDGYDVDHAGNMYTNEATDLFVDATLENLPSAMNDGYRNFMTPLQITKDYSADGVVAKSGAKSARIDNARVDNATEYIFHLPNATRGWKTNTYYLFSFYMYVKDATAKDAFAIDFRDRSADGWPVIALSNIKGGEMENLSVNQWTKVSYIVYSGSSTLMFMTAKSTAAGQYIYLDDFSLIELPANVQAAAKAFDEYDGDYSSYDAALASSVGATFASGSTFATLRSPVKGVSYAELYAKVQATDPNSIYGKQAKFAHLSGSLEGYDADHPGNLFNNTDPNASDTWVDAKLDLVTKITNNYNGYAKSPASGATQLSDGNWVVKLTGETVFHLPRANDTHKTKKNTYYIFSFDMYAETKAAYENAGILFKARDSVDSTGSNELSVTTNSGFSQYPTWTTNEYYHRNDMKVGQWNRVSVLVYTGKRELIAAVIGGSFNGTGNNYVYVDNFSFVELPADVQAAALALDNYTGDYTDDTTALKDIVGDVFADNTYAGLYSLTKPGVRYVNQYDQLSNAQYTVTKETVGNGTIGGDDAVAQGADATYTFTAAEGYVLKDVLIDGTSVGAVASYTFNRVIANHTVKAVFAAKEVSSDLLVVEGATIRKTLVTAGKENANDVDGQQGLRFRSVFKGESTITVDGKDYTVVGQGMLLAATQRLGTAELVCNSGNAAIFEGGRANVTDKEGYYTTYVYGIKESQKEVKLTTRAYVKCENADGDEVIFYSAVVTRSVKDVYDRMAQDAEVFAQLGDDVKAWF